MDLGIIGGQDGPTAIFISGNPAGLIITAFVVVAVIGGAVWFFQRKRKR